MPGAQFDELKLQVSLVDNASAQIKTLKSSLDELGTGSQANNLERLKRQTSDVDQALRKVIETVSKGPKAFLDLARNVTVAGISLGTFGLAVDKTLKGVDSLAQGLIGLLRLSQQTNFDPAAIKNIIKAYELAGETAATAESEMKKFSSALADITLISSKIRNEAAQGFGNDQQTLAMIKGFFDEINRMPDTVGKFEAAKKGLQSLFQYFRETGREDIGKIVTDKIAADLGLVRGRFIKEDVQPVTDAMQKHMQNQLSVALQYERTTQSISQNITSIMNALKWDIMDSGLIKGLKFIDGFLEKWKKWVETKPKTAEEKGAAAAATRPPSAPTTRAAPPYNPRSPVTRLLGGDEAGGGGGGGGGGLGIPAIGDLLRPQPGAITVPDGGSARTGWRGLPMSRNIEDRRTEVETRGNDLLENQNDQTKTLVGEMRRLNALLSGEAQPGGGGGKLGLLSMPGSGRAGVGTGGGYAPSTGYPPAATTPGGTTRDGTTQPPTTATQTTPTMPMPPAAAAALPGVTGPAAFGGGAGGGVAGGVPGLAGGPSGPALTKEQRAAGAAAAGGAAGGGAGGGGYTSDDAATQAIINERSEYMRQLQDPETRSLAAWAMREEQHDPARRSDPLEALVNRAVADNARRKAEGLPPKSIKEYLTDGFYKPVEDYRKRTGRLPRADDQKLKDFEQSEREVGGGSNRIAGRTDQGMESEHRADPRGKFPVRGEWYSWHRGGTKYERGTAAARAPRQAADAPTRTTATTPTTPPPTATTPPQAPPSPATTSTGPVSAAGLTYPVAGGTTLSAYGDPRPGGVTGKHQGLDIGAPSGTTITATSDQTITAVGVIGGKYGYGIKTTDSQGREHVYAHMLADPSKSHKLKIGDKVSSGTAIGLVGQSGNAKTTPPHLHYEVRPRVGAYAQSYDPAKLLPTPEQRRAAGVAQPVTRAPAPTTSTGWPRIAGPPPTGGSTTATETTTPPKAPTATMPPSDPTTRLYDTLRRQEEERASRQNATKFDVDQARKTMDRVLGARKINGTGDISVKVAQERTRRPQSVLKKVPMAVPTQGDRAEMAPPAPADATGGGRIESPA